MCAYKCRPHIICFHREKLQKFFHVERQSSSSQANKKGKVSSFKAQSFYSARYAIHILFQNIYVNFTSWGDEWVVVICVARNLTLKHISKGNVVELQSVPCIFHHINPCDPAVSKSAMIYSFISRSSVEYMT